MADLLTSLLLPNSSQESFHSSAEHPSPSSPTDASANHPSATPQSSFQSNLPAIQAAGLPIYDVDAYLAAPENANLLHRAPDRKNAPTKQPKPEIDITRPIPLGSKSGHHVSALYMLCQQKRLKPNFEIDGDASNADFGGLLKIGDKTIASDKRWHSKKEAREALAQMGIEIVKGIEATSKESSTRKEEDKNWVGMLMQYQQLVDPQQGPVYAEYSLGLSFSATCTIPSCPDQPFGSSTEPFPSKKAARTNAARLAIEYLIDKDELNADGSAKAPKKDVKLSMTVRIKGRGLEVKRESTYTQRVNDAYSILGFNPPQYTLEAASSRTPGIFNGYACFPNDPRFPEQIGEVRNIFGKKNAKEEIAKGVWEVFKRLAEKMTVNISEIDEGGEK